MSRESILENTKKNARESGYYLCPDQDMLDGLLDGLAANEERYGYAACPCRMASGLKTYDADIICPCEYRDADVNEFGMCYCCLYVSKEIKDDPSKMAPVPERRPVEVQDAAMEAKDKADRGELVEPGPENIEAPTSSGKKFKNMPVWRCTVCGYLAARERPPPICPICKAKADRFERFDL